MATYGATRRRGLPRVPGGEPWPPADLTEAPVAEERVDSSPHPSVEQPVAAAGRAEPAAVGQTSAPVGERTQRVGTTPGIRVRRGLPRVPGGEPWPPAHTGAGDVVAAAAEPAPASAAAEGAVRAASAPVTRHESTPRPPAPAAASGIVVRRGLPRVPGGDPWPPADFVAAPAIVADALVDSSLGSPLDERPAAVAPPAVEQASAPSVEHAQRDEGTSPREQAPAAREPLPFPRTVFPGAAAARWDADRRRATPFAPPEPVRVGPFTRLQWAGVVIVGGLGLLFAAGMLVLAVRWFVSLEFMRDFMATYPGEYHLPVGAPVGFPAWVGWQHFFNVFLMVLIIRSGLRVRSEKRPTAFWSRRGSKRKISLTLWFHQSLDVLWLVNGVVFVVLLFVTGQWLRIVPTSWEVFPNAITAALKYVSLDWPTEDGWVNYNSLQQLAYFATVFLAAPLAALTGVRMSGVWPKNAKTLNRVYPVEWARAVHFPVMIYFVLFIIVHVALVLATGALRNLNHMYGGSDQVNWVGFWIFAASLAVIAAGWAAARPLVLAPVARLFGTVTGR